MILKCKMCGGDLNFVPGDTVCECEFCGTKQTIPAADNEKKANLFNRANRLRMNAEFDKAASVYAAITAEFPEEAEAYWGLCLCKYGIEYVDDPATGNKIPTCHRTLPTSILDDPDFDQACENADAVAKKVYREEAKAIDRLQRDILEIVARETPYDVFICYKETGEDGGRTEDSVLAQDIYDSLTGKGLKVFFARITLEDKLGQQYEPYIYAALHSSKVMLSIGTQYEYFDAVWVKNEWARFLDLMKTDRTKTLIPCFKGLDAYDIPREFQQLQAQDMGKLGWLQDLTRGVMKLCGKDEHAVPVQQVVKTAETGAAALLDRALLALEDSEWEKADGFCEQALNLEAFNARAYIYKLMAERKAHSEQELAAQQEPFDESGNYQKALRFADETQRTQLNDLNTSSLLRKAEALLNDAKTVDDVVAVQRMLAPVKDRAEALLKKCEGSIVRIKDHERLIQEAEEKALVLKQTLDEQQKMYKQAENRLLNARQQMQTAEATRSEAIRRMTRLENQLQELRGLFNGKKRAELEWQIDQQRDAVEDAKAECSKLNAKLKAANDAMPAQPEVPEMKYQLGLLYLQAEKNHEALKCFLDIKGYKNVDNLLANDHNLVVAIEAAAAAAAARDAKYTVGNYVTFGSYPQTSGGNDSTPIEWLVLARDRNKVLLISRYGLDKQPYNKNEASITWEKCTLRTWLNSTFMRKAFTDQEQTGILLTNVDNSSSQRYSEWYSSGENNTKDKLFLLSYAEANKYLGVTYGDKTNTKSRVSPTAYAIKQGVYTKSDIKTADGSMTGWWWLRSPGNLQYFSTASIVQYAGSLHYTLVESDIGCVRPAMWIDLDSDYFKN